jgi:hypothetical protein
MTDEVALVPVQEMMEDKGDLSRIEKIKRLPKQLKFILQTDRKYKVQASRTVRLFFSLAPENRVVGTYIIIHRKHARRILCVQYVQSTYFSLSIMSLQLKNCINPRPPPRYLYVPKGQNVSILINCGHGLHSECKVWFEKDQKLASDLRKCEGSTEKKHRASSCPICLVALKEEEGE